MPRKKRAISGKNLGVYAQKKVKQKDNEEDQTPSSPALSLADQLGPDELFDWDATNTEDPAPGVPIDLGSDDEIESILSKMSEDEDVPTSDAHTLNGFLMKAAKNIQEVVKRSRDAAMKGLKATYAVKLGQTQSKRTINRHKQANVAAQREGIQGGNEITKWFRRQSETQDKSLRSRSGKSNGRSLSAESIRGDLAMEEEEDELESEDEPSMPPSTRAPSPSLSETSNNGDEFTDRLRKNHAADSEERFEPTSMVDIPPAVASEVDRDEEQSDRPQAPERGLFEPPPSLESARSALAGIKLVLNPPQDTGVGHKDPGYDLLLRGRLDLMKMFLWRYIDSLDGWIASSLQVAHAAERGPWLAKRLREWTRAYIKDPECLPLNVYGRWNVSLLEDEDLANEISLHLQGIGKWVKAMDIVHFLDTPEMKLRLKLKKTNSLATAQRWMRVMNYRWTKTPNGQFVDGHERDDVVEYRQLIFLLAWEAFEPSMRSWTKNIEDARPVNVTGLLGPRIIVWHHDESTFYANDRRKIRWVHKDEKAVPYAKGEGASLMVADFVSTDYGWLRSPDGKEEARVLFKAGKAQQGYFTNEDILSQANAAMDILEKHFPEDKHVLLFDNATTHQKRAADALSASKMPKFIPKEGKNWGVETNVLGADGKPTYSPDGKILKMKVQMTNGILADGSSQCFYFPHGHPRAGVFKGMAIILEERGFSKASDLQAQCKDFKCEKGATTCCCRRILYNQPDFVNVKSNLEIICEARGFQVIFLPKFHCEINFIEQCWGYAK
jgi:hypothetical protein